MGLKIKQIPELKNSLGYKLENSIWSFSDVSFRTSEQVVAVECTTTPEDYDEKSGVQKERRTALIPIDLTVDLIRNLIESNSDAIHEIIMDIPFIQTNDGMKSFRDLNAVTIDIGWGE